MLLAAVDASASGVLPKVWWALTWRTDCQVQHMFVRKTDACYRLIVVKDAACESARRKGHVFFEWKWKVQSEYF